MEKGIPKMDGSGGGTRENRGRGGCNPPADSGLKKDMGLKADTRGMGQRRGIKVRIRGRGFGRGRRGW